MEQNEIKQKKMFILRRSQSGIPKRNKESFSKFTLCPKCHKSTNLVITQSNKLHLSCTYCYYDSMYSIDKYFEMIETVNKKKKIMNKQCEEHSMKDNTFFCYKCNAHFCIKCQDKHLDHSDFIYELDKMLNEDKFKEIQAQYKDIKTHYEIYSTKIKENIIEILHKEINKINDSYNESLIRNHYICKVIDVLIDNYKNFRYDYYIINNLLENTKFKKNEIIFNDNSISSKINTILSFYSSNCIIEKHYIDSLSNLITKRTLINDKESYVNSLLILSDGRIASSYSDCSIKVHNVQTFELELSIEQAHTKGINYLSQLNTNLILSCSDDKIIKIWEIKSKEYKLIQDISIHSSPVCRAFPINHNKVVSFEFNGKSLKIWNSVSPYNIISQINLHNTTIELALEVNNLLALACDDSVLRFYDSYSNKCLHSISNIQTSSRNSMIVLKNNKLIVGGYNTLIVIDTSCYTIEKRIEDEDYEAIDCFLQLSDGSLLCALGDMNGRAFVQIELNKYEIISEKENAHESHINGIVYINERMFASCSDDKMIKIWKY